MGVGSAHVSEGLDAAPFPTHATRTCAKFLTRMFSSLFVVNGPQNEAHMIRHKHTLRNHAMPYQPCLGLAWRGEGHEHRLPSHAMPC